ncbi:MAG TPA: hypothetical protein DCX95_03075 [Elusimicrobia bacterium]|nr:hypothetical protein [Elusimicrobiota bacterium]
MFIAKAKRLTEALAKSDALKIPRSEIVLMMVHDGVEIHTLTDSIIADIKLWCSDLVGIERKPRRSANFY